MVAFNKAVYWVSHGSESLLVGFEFRTTVVTNSSLFWGITPCSPFKANRRLGGTYRLGVQGRRIIQARNQHEAGSKQRSYTSYSTLNMEAKYSSETSVDFQRTTCLYIPEDRTLHNHRCDNLRSYKSILICHRFFYGIYSIL
jgi:hypothetical protein